MLLRQSIKEVVGAAGAAGAAIGVTGGTVIGTTSGISRAAGGGRVEAVSTAYCWVAVGAACWGIDAIGG